MEYNIRMYEHFDEELNKGSLKVDEIKEFNEQFMNQTIHTYIQNNSESFFDELSQGRRLLRLLTRHLDKNTISFQVGRFMGIYQSLDGIRFYSDSRDKFEEKMLGVKGKSGYIEVLNYLYQYPNAQHKSISNDLNIKKSYLTQILTELREIHSVERYGVGKRSFFSLSIKGEQYIKNEMSKNKSDWNTRKKEGSNYAEVFNIKYGMDRSEGNGYSASSLQFGKNIDIKFANAKRNKLMAIS